MKFMLWLLAGLPLIAQDLDLSGGWCRSADDRPEYARPDLDDRFTFISDGVFEAQNAQRELFGFDRTREISGQAAQEIAAAAQAWGQTDDITVVTVRRVL